MKLNELFLQEIKRENGWPQNKAELETRYFEWSNATDTGSEGRKQKFNADLTVSVKGSFCIGGAFNSSGSVNPTTGRPIKAPFNLSTTLPFKLKEVDGIMSINGMKRLKTLEGCPEKVSRSFNVRSNPALENLEGAPKNIEGRITIANCDNLKTLRGLPKQVESLEITDLPSLGGFEGFPEHYADNLRIEKNCITSLIGIADHIKFIGGGGIELPAKGIVSGGLGLLQIEGLTSISVLGMLMKGSKNPWRIIYQHLQGDRDVFDCQEELIEAGFEAYAQL